MVRQGLTYIKECASMLQYELTRVWFVLTVIHIYVELISLKTKQVFVFMMDD